MAAAAIAATFVVVVFLNTHERDVTGRVRVEALKASCVKRVTDMRQLIQMLRQLQVSQKTDPECQMAWEVFQNIFEVSVSTETHLEVPEEMQETAMNWVGGDQDLYSQLINPTILTMTNKWTLETVGWNPLRGSKPQPNNNNKQEEQEMVEKLMRNTSGFKNCDFCAKHRTAMPAGMGRLENVQHDVYTASNAFTYFDDVGIVIPRKFHDFRDIDWPTFVAIFDDVVVRWFKSVHSIKPHLTHPHLIWDTLEKGGASQVHPHLQLWLGSHNYMGKMRSLSEAAKRYQMHHQRNYFEDFVMAHALFGLTLSVQDAVIVAPLVAQLDHEFVVLDMTQELENGLLSRDFIKAYYLVRKTLQEELTIYCTSSAMALPPVPNTGSYLPAIARTGSRGKDCLSPVSDISSLNIYSAHALSSNLFANMEALKSARSSSAWTFKICPICTVCSLIKAKWQLSLQLRYLHFFWPCYSIEQAIVHFEVNFWNSKSKIVVTTLQRI